MPDPNNASRRLRGADRAPDRKAAADQRPPAERGHPPDKPTRTSGGTTRTADRATRTSGGTTR
ncbi:hypothetical protein, partial [Streptomyces europaeiscabiei]